MKLALKWRSTSLPQNSQVKPYTFYIFLQLELQHAFKLYDADKNGTMNAEEFKQVLADLGKRDVTDQQVMEMLAQVDRNNDKVIQWEEFIDVFPLLL